MKIQAKAWLAFDRTLDFLFLVAAVLFVFAMLGICADVVARYFLNAPITGVIEICGYIVVWCTFMGAAYALRKDKHIKMDAVVSQLNPRARSLLRFITSIIGLAVCLVVTWYSAQLTWHNFQTGYIFAMSRWEAPRFPFNGMVTVGLLLVCIQFMRSIPTYFRSWRASASKE